MKALGHRTACSAPPLPRSSHCAARGRPDPLTFAARRALLSARQCSPWQGKTAIVQAPRLLPLLPSATGPERRVGPNGLVHTTRPDESRRGGRVPDPNHHLDPVRPAGSTKYPSRPAQSLSLSSPSSPRHLTLFTRRPVCCSSAALTSLVRPATSALSVKVTVPASRLQTPG